MNALVTTTRTNAEVYRESTDAAGLCREIVLNTAMKIGDRRYVKVEGWQAIAIAHGCTGSACNVEKVDGGIRATGEIRRMSDGALIAQAEGFVGEDEPTWYGGEVEKDEWSGPKGNRRPTGKKIITVLPKRAEYAIRAMAQTRAISRACRSAFAHVVVLIDANLSTTPAEEVPFGGFDNNHDQSEPRDVTPKKDGDVSQAVKDAQAKAKAAMVDCKAGIDACDNLPDLRAWWPANQTVLDFMPDPEFLETKAYYEARQDALTKSAGGPARHEVFE